MVAKSVQTVLGLVPSNQLGIILPHEHVLCDLTHGATSVAETLHMTESAETGALIPEAGWESRRHGPGTAASWLAKWDTPITLENLADVQRNHYYYGHSKRLLNVDDAIDEVHRFKLAGGGCIVDATVTGMARDPRGLQQVSRATGLHVVMTSGYYYGSYHPAQIREWGEDEVFEQIVSEVREGVAGVFPGMIKSAVHYPIWPDEAKVLRAASRAQALTGLPLSIHPGTNPASPFEAVRLVEAAGGDLTRTVMLHVDGRLFDRKAMFELASTGCYMSFDAFGREQSFRQRGPVDIPNDAARLNHMMALAAQGHEKQLLMSQDCALKFMLHKWGGLGYDHILLNVVPLMRYKGFTKELIEQLIVKNPVAMLAGGS